MFAGLLIGAVLAVLNEIGGVMPNILFSTMGGEIM